MDSSKEYLTKALVLYPNTIFFSYWFFVTSQKRRDPV